MVSGYEVDIEEILNVYLSAQFTGYNFYLEDFHKKANATGVRIVEAGTFGDSAEAPIMHPRVEITSRSANKKTSKDMAIAMKKYLHGKENIVVVYNSKNWDIHLIRLNSGINFSQDPSSGLNMHTAFYEVIIKGNT